VNAVDRKDPNDNPEDYTRRASARVHRLTSGNGVVPGRLLFVHCGREVAIAWYEYAWVVLIGIGVGYVFLWLGLEAIAVYRLRRRRAKRYRQNVAELARLLRSMRKNG